MRDPQSLSWSAIGTALVISVVIAVATGAAWGVVAGLLFLAPGEEPTASVMSPAGYCVGFVVSLVPVLGGTLSLLKSIDTDALKHCVVFGVAYVALQLAIGLMLGDLSFSWHDVLFYAAVAIAPGCAQQIVSRM